MQRLSNIELLRILSILMIVVHHVLVHGVYHVVNHTTLHFIDSFVIYGVNIFLLISGFFTIKLKWKSVINLFWICSFWKLFHLSYETFVGKVSHNLFEWIAKPLAIPFSAGGWFIDIYILLLLLSPILNMTLTRMNKKELRLTILLMTIFNIVYCWGLGKEHNVSGYSLYHFIYMYTLGFYLKSSSTSYKYPYLGIIVCSISTFILSLTLGGRAFSYNSPFAVMGALCIFMVFNKLTIESNIINITAQSVLSIYLLSDGGLFAKNTYQLYNDIMQNSTSIPTASIKIAGVVLAVCIFAILMDKIRIMIFQKGIYPCMEYISYKYHNNSNHK